MFKFNYVYLSVLWYPVTIKTVGPCISCVCSRITAMICMIFVRKLWTLLS